MNHRQHLIILIGAYAKVKGLALPTVSNLLFSSGIKYQQLLDGADLNVGRLENAVRQISADWPESTPWPEGIARPLPAPKDEVA